MTYEEKVQWIKNKLDEKNEEFLLDDLMIEMGYEDEDEVEDEEDEEEFASEEGEE